MMKEKRFVIASFLRPDVTLWRQLPLLLFFNLGSGVPKHWPGRLGGVSLGTTLFRDLGHLLGLNFGSCVFSPI